MPEPAIFVLPDRFEQRPDLYEKLAQLRDQGPVARIQLPSGLRPYLVLRHADVRALLADSRLSTNPDHAAEDLDSSLNFPKLRRNTMIARSMSMLDPPEHTRLRRQVARWFSPHRSQQMRPALTTAANDLIDRVSRRGEADLISDLASPLPMRVTGQILGMPPADLPEFYRWTESMLQLPTSPDAAAEIEQARSQVHRYLTQIVMAKLDQPSDDLLGMLASASSPDRLSVDELVTMAQLLLLAGYEPPRHVIGLSLLTLLRHPDHLTYLREHPESVRPACTELLRYDGPAPLGMPRFTTTEIDIRGTVIPARRPVLLCTGSANRDPEVFDAPDTLRFDRPETTNIAFGSGPHYCIGAELGKLQCEAAIAAVVTRLHDLELAIPYNQLTWLSGRARGVTALPLRFTATR